MHTGGELPSISATAIFSEVIKVISATGVGMACVEDYDGLLVGVVTDGDIRRSLAKTPDFTKTIARDLMSPDPHRVQPDTLAVDALNIMEQNRITSLPVTDESGKLNGILHLHDLWQTEWF